jgi:hypothetical protein
VTIHVPRGYLTTAQAVVRVFQARHPDLAASASAPSARQAELQRLQRRYDAEFPGPNPPSPTLTEARRWQAAVAPRRARIAAAVDWRDAARLRRTNSITNSNPEQPEQLVGTFDEADLARLLELRRVETEHRRVESEAAMELRSALAEGDLTADVLTDAGALVPLGRSLWLGTDGLTTVRRGQVPGTHTPPVAGTVLIKEDRFLTWIKQGKQDEAELSRLTKTTSMRAEPDTLDNASLNNWMADYADAQLALNKVPAKRDDALRACRDKNQCTYREALAAWMALPGSVKRKARETNRAAGRKLTGH